MVLLRLSSFIANLKRNFLLYSIFLVLFVSASWYFLRSAPDTKIPVSPVVTVVHVRAQTIEETIQLLGTIHARHITMLTAQRSGQLDILLRSGDKVRKGDLLAKINNPDVERKHRLALATVRLAEKQVKPLRDLVKKGYVSTLDFHEKKRTLIEAKKEFSNVRIEHENLRFYAPFDGIIGLYKKGNGAYISQGEGVVSMYDPESLLVDINFPCQHYPWVQSGYSVSILKKNYSITHLQRMIDEESGMCPADVFIQCTSCLVGDVVDVTVRLKEKQDALVVPFSAVFLKQAKPAVYVVHNGKIMFKPVKTGIQQQGTVEVVSGLASGDAVVVTGQEHLSPGMSVITDHTQTQHGKRNA